MGQSGVSLTLDFAEGVCAERIELYEQLVEGVATLRVGLATHGELTHQAISQVAGSQGPEHFWKLLEKFGSLKEEQLSVLLGMLNQISKEVKSAFEAT